MAHKIVSIMYLAHKPCKAMFIAILLVGSLLVPFEPCTTRIANEYKPLGSSRRHDKESGYPCIGMI
jgi:hypothetical protein